ncbi:MAG: hypothetical protein MUE69_13260 [Myxococcota bacterium]|nr:hypothetical protein [Myxococcota bacterium]
MGRATHALGVDVRARAARRVAIVIVATVALLACASDPPVRCRFEDSHTIGASPLGASHVALVHRTSGLVAFWSAREGLYARALDAEGAATAEARRLGPECDGGIAATSVDDELVIACSRRARDDKAQDGSVALIALDDRLAVRRVRSIARVGRDSLGVDLARRSDGTWSVIWHDGSIGAWAVRRARVSLEDATLAPDREDGDEGTDALVEAQELSSGVLAASPFPRVHVRASDAGDEALFVFEESWLDGGFARGRVLVARERGGLPIAVEELEANDARAQLVHDGRSWVLVFRDLRRPSPRASLYARRLGDDLRPVEPARRVTRADTDGSPRALTCGEHLVAVVPRTWDTDVLVGLDLLDARLRKPVPEQQVYEWSARFPFADAVCVDDAVLTLVASRPSVGGGGAALHTIGMRCSADDPP